MIIPQIGIIKDSAASDFVMAFYVALFVLRVAIQVNVMTIRRRSSSRKFRGHGILSRKT